MEIKFNGIFFLKKEYDNNKKVNLIKRFIGVYFLLKADATVIDRKNYERNSLLLIK